MLYLVVNILVWSDLHTVWKGVKEKFELGQWFKSIHPELLYHPQIIFIVLILIKFILTSYTQASHTSSHEHHHFYQPNKLFCFQFCFSHTEAVSYTFTENMDHCIYIVQYNINIQNKSKSVAQKHSVHLLIATIVWKVISWRWMPPSLLAVKPKKTFSEVHSIVHKSHG